MLFIILGIIIFVVILTIIIVVVVTKKSKNTTPIPISTTPIPITTSSTTPTPTSPPNFPGNLTIGVGNGAVSASIVYSTDNGITWTAADLSNVIFSNIGYAVCYNGYIYVAGGWGSSNSLAYSNDGITWIGLGTNIFSQVYCIHWTGNQFIAGGVRTTLAAVAHSSDGINWQLSNDITSLLTSISSITSSTSGNIIACGFRQGTNLNMISSTDGINWSSISSTFNLFIQTSSVYWTGTSFLVGGFSNSTIARSINGIDWTPIIPGLFTNTCTGFVSNGSRIVAVGSNSTVGNSTIAYSDDDGQTWTLATGVNVPIQGCLSVTWNGTNFVAGYGSPSSSNLVYSPDGINWTANPVTELSGIYSLSWNGKSI
jgi:hypothetical protein